MGQSKMNATVKNSKMARRYGEEFERMDGMGRDFDGSYAEHVLAPEKIVFVVQTQLDWKIFGALPEMTVFINLSKSKMDKPF
jgi:D-arabinose 1-dehydrogenase-like Zn-dependent alcohol dehydrogenase